MKTKVWVINGHDDDGDWVVELYSTYEKAKAVFDGYVKEISTNYETEVEVDNDSASYDTGNHYGKFWINETEVQ